MTLCIDYIFICMFEIITYMFHVYAITYYIIMCIPFIYDIFIYIYYYIKF